MTASAPSRSIGVVGAGALPRLAGALGAVAVVLLSVGSRAVAGSLVRPVRASREEGTASVQRVRQFHSP